MIIPGTTHLAACLGTGACRLVPEETPIALVYGGTTHAVMMATPGDLEDFALGFSLTEGIISSASEISDLAVVPSDAGVEVRMWLRRGAEKSFRDRRRHVAGPTGCGLCGIESLSAVDRVLPHVASKTILHAHTVTKVLDALCAAQILSHATHATHAAGLFQLRTGLITVREDVGRHNALDKLAGAIARAAIKPDDCAIVITSRVSVEMVQKAAIIGAPILIAMSAPTALAIRTANAAGITLLAMARNQSFQVFTHAWRVGTSV
jgi:FdhD protein